MRLVITAASRLASLLAMHQQLYSTVLQGSIVHTCTAVLCSSLSCSAISLHRLCASCGGSTSPATSNTYRQHQTHLAEYGWAPAWHSSSKQAGQLSVTGCYIEHRPFEEPTQGSLAIPRTTAIYPLSYHNWEGLAGITAPGGTLLFQHATDAAPDRLCFSPPPLSLHINVFTSVHPVGGPGLGPGFP